MIELRKFKANLAHKQPSQRGFTIVELMIATLVFSVIMLVTAGTVVRFTNNFQKSLTQTATQNAARSTVDLISQPLQFIGNGNGFRSLPSPSGSDSRGYCIQGTRYSYVLGKQLEDQVPHVLMEQQGTGDGCDGKAQDISSGSVSGKELLGPHMRLAKFYVRNDAEADLAYEPGGPGEDGSLNQLLYKIDIKVVYGASDLLCVEGENNNSAKDCRSSASMTDADVTALSLRDLAKLQCKTQRGSEFCAVSEISTTVQRRL